MPSKRKPSQSENASNAEPPSPLSPPPAKATKKKPVIQAVKDKIKVTSRRKKTNLRDYVVSWGGAGLTALIGFVSSLWGLLAHVLDVTADSIINYLKQIPQTDRPAWVALVAFFAMGLVILNRRKQSAPDYSPPTTPSGVPSSPPNSPLKPPPGQPMPPGTSPPPPQNSAF